MSQTEVPVDDVLEAATEVVPIAHPAVDLGPARFLNRELSWLDFNTRVLALAEDPTVPLLERVKFLAIFSDNLDEFYQVRVAGLVEQVHQGVAEISKADFEASIERKINFMVPFDIKAAANAAKLGQAFVDANRSTKAAGAIRDVAKSVLGAADADLPQLRQRE